MTTLRIIALVCIGLYILICILVYSFQEKLLFHPTTLPLDHSFQFSIPFEEVIYKTNDNAQIHTLYFKSYTSKGVILYFHGNAGAADSWGHIAPYFVALGYDVVLPDYRTYGKSTGQLSEAALYEDAQMIYDSLNTQYSEQNMIIYGRSLGSGIATHLASNTTPKLLILETPFLSINKIAQDLFSYLPVNLLLKYNFENNIKVKKIESSIHLIHGTTDQIIPYWHSEKLAEQIGKQGVLTTIEGGNHNNLGTFVAYDEIMRKLLLE